MTPALYDLSCNPTTYDFACFAVVAKTLGHDTVRFSANNIGADTVRKYPPVLGWRRWANICVPICSLAGLQFEVDTVAAGQRYGYHTGAVEGVYKKYGRIAKLSIPPATRKGYVTITMRKSNIHQWRDSNVAEWKLVKTWLEERGESVYWIEDCEWAPMFVEHRMAVYGAAKMNLSVGNGPMVLCWLSEAPYLSFQLPHARGHDAEYKTLVDDWTRLGFPVGSQLSFRNERQEIVWGPDDFDLITERYERMFAHV